jgi:hypothetical protein
MFYSLTPLALSFENKHITERLPLLLSNTIKAIKITSSAPQGLREVQSITF